MTGYIFTIDLQDSQQKLRQMELEIRIGTRLNVLVFADDVLLAENIEDLHELTKVLIQETDHVGLDFFSPVDVLATKN